ncbi:hypothetical protein JTB14_021218 [Gonioctena quinquepunctata]|nr:hypothetical protein JTB14_021218 [Gonioctena quinquepunctata]
MASREKKSSKFGKFKIYFKISRGKIKITNTYQFENRKGPKQNILINPKGGQKPNGEMRGEGDKGRDPPTKPLPKKKEPKTPPQPGDPGKRNCSRREKKGNNGGKIKNQKQPPRNPASLSPGGGKNNTTGGPGKKKGGKGKAKPAGSQRHKMEKKVYPSCGPTPPATLNQGTKVPPTKGEKPKKKKN